VIELKARLYDIEIELKKLKQEKQEKRQRLKEKALTLKADLFLHTELAIAKEIELLAQELANICERMIALGIEKQDLERRLELCQ